MTLKQIEARMILACLILAPFILITVVDGWRSLFAVLTLIGVAIAGVAVIGFIVAAVLWSIKNL